MSFFRFRLRFISQNETLWTFRKKVCRVFRRYRKLSFPWRCCTVNKKIADISDICDRVSDTAVWRQHTAAVLNVRLTIPLPPAHQFGFIAKSSIEKKWIKRKYVFDDVHDRQREHERDKAREKERKRVFNSFLHAAATGCRSHTRPTFITLHMQPTQLYMCTNVRKQCRVPGRQSLNPRKKSSD